MLDLTRTKLTFSAPASRRLPENPGSSWRGAFGHQLRRLVCITGADVCDNCPVARQCRYAEIFEPRPNQSGMLKNYPQAPAGYVLQPGPGGDFARNETHTLGITLLGRCARHRKMVDELFMQIAKKGLKADQGWTVSQKEAYPLPVQAAPINIVTMSFHSPLRLRIDNHYISTPDALEFAPLFSTLLRRITQLQSAHGEICDDIPARELVDHARGIRIVRRDMKLIQDRRYSSRQHQSMSISGLQGSITIQGDLAPLWPWLWFGQYTHVGKLTTIGLGRYSLSAAQVP